MARGITRKELKRDEFVEATVDASHWLEQHWQKVAGAVAAVLIVIVAVTLWSWNARQNRIEAREELAGTIRALQRSEEQGYPDRGVLEGLLPRFEAVVERGGDDAAASTASYYAAVVLSRLERFDEAAARAEAVVGPDVPVSLQAAAAALRARIDEAAGRPEAALERWQAMVDGTGAAYPADQALLEAGRLHRRLGDEVAARDAWQRILDEYPAGGAANEARRLLGS